MQALTILCLSSASGALAQHGRPGASEPPPEAIQLYLQGKEHYREGRYTDAIVDLKAALELDPNSPNLMYNVARVSELLGNLNEAIDYYRRYLKALAGSETEERNRIRETIQRLEGARAEVVSHATREQDTLKAPTAGPQPRPVGEADLLFWTTAATGSALLVGAGVTGVLALGKENQVADYVAGESADGTLGEREALIDQANSLALTSDILLASGAAMLTTAALLFFLRTPGSADQEAPEARLGTDGRGLRLELDGRF